LEFPRGVSVPRAPASLGGLPLLTLPTRSASCRVRPPFGPLAWRPPRQSPKVLVPTPPQGPGALPTPGGPPCVTPGGVGRPLPGLGRSAPPRVVGVRRPMPLVAHGGLPCITLRLCVPSPPSTPGPRSSLALSLSRALAPYPGSPPLVRCRRPSRRRPGGERCLLCCFRLLLVGVWGSSGLGRAWGLSVVPVVSGWFPGPLPRPGPSLR